MRWLLPPLAAFLSLTLLASLASAKEAPAYIAIGDSLAFGVGATDPSTGGYVPRLHDALLRSDRYRGRGLELVNLGVPGATSADILLPDGQLQRALDEIRERKDDTSSADDNLEIITVDIGGNDVLTLATPDSPCLADVLSADCQDDFQGVLEALEENLTETLTMLREAAPKADIVVLDLYSPLSGRGGPAELVADLAIRQINQVTEKVVADPDLGVKLASVYGLFRGRAEQLVAEDNFHPNDDGHALMAEVALAAVEDRAPVPPTELMTPAAVQAITGQPEGIGGLEPVGRSGDGPDVPVLLAIAIPVAVLGAASIVGAYLAARGR